MITRLGIVLLSGILLLSAPASAQVDNMERYEVSSAIVSAGTDAVKVRRLKAVPSVGVLSISFRNRLGMDQIRDYQMSEGRNFSKIMKLRAALRANPVTRKALQDHHIDINRIVGVRVGSNGALRVFVE